MHQIPSHPSASTTRSIAALVVVILMFLALSLSVTDLGQDGLEPFPRPLPAGATLDLLPTLIHATGGLEP